MRAPLLSAALLALPACLSAPTGRDPDPGDVDAAGTEWPPPGADIIAIAAGDLDGDGKDDLIAADAAGARIFFLRGGGDIDPTRQGVDTVTASAPLAGLRQPAAVHVAVIGSARFVVVLDSPPSGARVTVFDMSLQQTGTTEVPVPLPPGGERVTINRSTFGMDMNATFLTFPAAVAFIEGDRLDDASPSTTMVPGATFSRPLGATGYPPPGAPPMSQVVVTEVNRIQRAAVNGGGNFNWSDLRTGGPPWTAQAFVGLDGDMFPDLIAFAPDGGNDAQICGADLDGGVVLACYQTPFGMDSAELATGSVAGPAQLDAILLDVPPPPRSPSLFMVRNLRIDTGAIAADGVGPPFTIGLPAPHHAVLQLDSGAAEVVVVGRDGRIVCARASGNDLTLCAP